MLGTSTAVRTITTNDSPGMTVRHASRHGTTGLGALAISGLALAIKAVALTGIVMHDGRADKRLDAGAVDVQLHVGTAIVHMPDRIEELAGCFHGVFVGVELVFTRKSLDQ
jgi:hypothetical protein